MKVLITGAGGFIGRHLVEEALRRDDEVWAGVRATSSLDGFPPERVQRINLIYDDPQAMARQVEEHVRRFGPWEYVIHNAGVTKTAHPADFFQVNAGYTLNLLNALAQMDCKPKKFLLMSSLGAFGGGEEETFRPIHPDDRQMPETAYGRSKRLAEMYVREQRDFPYLILRPTGVYGPGDKDYRKVIRSICAGFDFAAGLKPQFLTFIYVKDLVNIAFRALTNETLLNRCYFVTDGRVYTDTDFTRLIRELVGKKHLFRLRLPLGIVYLCCLGAEIAGRITGRAMTLNTDKYRILKQRNWVCDITELRKDLDFAPAYDLRRGLEETIRLDPPERKK